MIETVYILGAGASHDGGAPLMGNFFDIARRLQPRIADRAIAEEFALVFKGISELQIVHSKSDLDIDNLETVFGAFEMAQLLQSQIGHLTPEEVGRLTNAMKTLIVHTIEETLQFPIREQKTESNLKTGYVGEIRQSIEPPPPYEHLIAETVGSGRSSAFITFNYDLALDHGIVKSGRQVEYHLGDSVQQEAVPLLKLHGSMNWGACTACDKPQAVVLDQMYANPAQIRVNQFFTYRIKPQRFAQLKCCANGKVEGPVIVPPTWSKGEHHQRIARVWSSAAQYLSKARNIVVIGYSLPPSDMFFRFLYALGTIGEQPLNSFVVLDPDSNVVERFKALLGIAARKRFHWIQNWKFDSAGAVQEILRAIA